MENIDFNKSPKDHVTKLSSRDIHQHFGVKIIAENDVVLIDIINDVQKLARRFREQITKQNIEENNFKQDLYKMLRAFTLYRPDLAYSRSIAYLASIFLLNCENYYLGFVCLANIIIPNHLSRFFLRDEKFIKLRYNFFDEIFMTYLPGLYIHFKNMDISISLFIYTWIEYIFTNYFNYEMLLRVWDCYIIKGEIIIYEIALTILKVQEKDLTNLSVNEILSSLKRFSSKIQEDEFFDVLQDIDISEYYNMIIDQNNLANEKAQIYESLL